VVYANYGREEDFRRLEEMGIEVAGRIVLVRYGAVFRGLKVKEAQQRGAAGVVIYSDPADDGYMQGDVYPDGPMRPPYSLQRGSVQFLSVAPGDPQTPGWASTEGARRLAQDEIDEMARIPSLPLSYGEAEKVLRALSGERVPDDWQGGLPFAYHLGPGPAKLRMAVEMDYAVRPIWNVIATLRGSEEPDRWVVLGNHRDAWTYGAVDPNSGTAAMLETARALGEAVRAGWRPRRTLVLASWDGEEYGLVGSTEWGEQFAGELGVKAVAYVNLDSAVTGTELSLSGIPSLRDLTLGVAGELTDPKRGRTLLELWLDGQREEWADEGPIDLDRPDRPFRPALEALGSGSDYTVFVDHLGVASLNFTFSGKYGVYHSALDAFYWMQRFGDPEFLYHALAARFYGLVAMRLAGAELVPLRYVAYAEALEDQLDALRRRAIRERRKGAGSEGERGEAAGTPAPEPSPETAAGEAPEEAPAGPEGELAAAPVPEELAGTASEAPPLDPDFAPVLAAVARFRAAAEGLDAALDAAGPLPLDRRSRINDAVVAVERRLLDPAGLPGRPWFRHVLYAPGLTTGYAPWPFPGLAQAVKDHDAAMWQAQAATVVERLDAATAALGEAAALAR
jgi:N-acetylated-alpha-linked acidic dipeptidase